MADQVGTIDNFMPDWYTKTAQGIAGGLQDMTGNKGYIQNALNNWYNPPQRQQNPYAGQPQPTWNLGAPAWQQQYGYKSPSTWNQGAPQGGSNPGVEDEAPTYHILASPLATVAAADSANSSGTRYNAASLATVAAADSANSSGTRYNAASLAQYMNPYIKNVVEEQARLSNLNYNEKIVPGINSTFAGAGQFGSSRNGDLLARMTRDQQTQLAGAQGNALMSSMDSANKNYLGWQTGDDANRHNIASEGLQSQEISSRNRANDQADARGWANIDATNNQQDFTNWLTKVNYPLSALGQVGQVLNQVEPPAQYSQVSMPAPTGAEKAAGLIGLGNTAINSGTLSNALGGLSSIFNADGSFKW